MTGIFPKTRDEHIPTGPVSLVFCPESGLLQMKQSYSLTDMYGDNYGYRSGLNASMVKHLHQKAKFLQTICPLDSESVVIDVGGNDGTFLKGFDVEGLIRISVDPTTRKWLDFHKGTNIIGIGDFFPAKTQLPKADILTSIACFYDLEDPQAFVHAVAAQLKPDGIWHCEQSYAPAMLRTNSYDTVCHEHLEYYTLQNLVDLLDKAGMRVIDVQFNDVNGGSFAVTSCLKDAHYFSLDCSAILDREQDLSRALSNFTMAAAEHRDELRYMLKTLKGMGKSIGGCGASTKGNVLLQFCRLTDKDLQYIADVNPDKHGRFTPGSLIPIVSEEYAALNPVDYKIVLPWHFRDSIIQRERAYLEQGGRLIFPLPKLEVVGKEAL